MSNTSQNNKATISGKIASGLVFSHEVFGEKFYTFDLSVERLSKTVDIIPVTISERIIAATPLRYADKLTVIGQFRSYNKLIDGRSKLMLTVFATDITLQEEETFNEVMLVGYICKPPIFRTTPFNREICDILLAVNRAYNKSDYIPCIAWGRNAKFIRHMNVGEQVVIYGRIQSRSYQKRISESEFETRIAYEVSVSRISLENDSSFENEVELANVVASTNSLQSDNLNIIN